MANILIKFIDFFYEEEFMTVRKRTHKTTNQDFIHVIIGSNSEPDNNKEILLDKSTAIKVAKTLRAEINKMQS